MHQLVSFLMAMTGLFFMNSSIAQTKDSPLSQKQAELRSKLITNVSYELDFVFSEKKDSFKAKAVLKFDLKPKAKSLSSKTFIDLFESKILSIRINGEEKELSYQNNRISLPMKGLNPKANQIEIHYERAFTGTGNGLHRFVDPVDQSIYFYSNLEPYYARQIFPCFDQPDLKATFSVSVLAPKKWEIIANAPVHKKTSKSKNFFWNFRKTKTFSTYLFALHGGPFHHWRSRAKNVPMKLYVRKSLKKYVDYKEWFQITRHGLDFFAKKFKIPYPFEKYDQIIVPDFNWGAMENVGAVTFSERFVHRSKVTQEMRIDRADVILHEMAHMWFGNLVTMKWWNDLWLNESFATFAAAWSLEYVAPKIKLNGVWEGFFKDMKNWAYYEDQMPTTHSIKAIVNNTDEAFASFDGITYGKGAAVLKQVYFLMGDKNFSKGMETYFKEYQYKNTELKDFMKHLSKAWGRSLTKWQNQWLQSPGTNTLKAQYQCNQNKTKDFKLIQGRLSTPSNISNPLREHRTQVGLYYLDSKNNLKLKNKQSIEYKGKTTPVPALDGKSCPDFVFVNEGDYDFSALEFDEASLKAIENHLSTIDSDLTRLQIWHALFQLFYHAKLPAQRFIDIAIRHLKEESYPIIERQVLNWLTQFRTNWISALLLVPKGETQKTYQIKLEKFFLSKLKGSKRGSDSQLLYFQNYLSVVKTDEGLELVQKWLKDSSILPGIKADQVRRWELVFAHAQKSLPNAKKIIQNELKRDSSDYGKKMAAFSQSALTDDASSQKWLDILTKGMVESDQPKKPLPILKFAMSSYHHIDRDSDLQKLEDVFYRYLPKIDKKIDSNFVEKYVRVFFPMGCTPISISKLKKFLSSNPRLKASTKKKLKSYLFHMNQCKRASQTALSWENKSNRLN